MQDSVGRSQLNPALQTQLFAVAAVPSVFGIDTQDTTHLSRIVFQVAPDLHWHLVAVANTPMLSGSRVQSRRHSAVPTNHRKPGLQTQLTLSTDWAPLLLAIDTQSSLQEKVGDTVQTYLGLHLQVSGLRLMPKDPLKSEQLMTHWGMYGLK